MKKYSKKLLAVTLAIIMLFTIPMSASAYEIDTKAPETAEESAIQPRSFDKTVQVSLSSYFKNVFEDDNWWGEPKVKITFKKDYSDQNYIKVYVVDKYGNRSETRTLYENYSYSFTIPAGRFEVWAAAGDTTGTVDIGVQLSWS